MTQATGVGSLPGTDVAAAVSVVVGELARDEGVPFLPELPARGPGADLVGRGAGLLVDLGVDLQPSGWRLLGPATTRPGRDLARTAAYLREDVERWTEALEGWTGQVKLQVAGPATLWSALQLPRGERVAVDGGARTDVAASLAEGVASHVAAVARLLPAAEVVLQVDEPGLPAVLEGRLPTQSGFGRLPAVEASEVETAVRAVLEGARSGGAALAAVHCCGADVPVALLRRAGAELLSVDVSLLGAVGWEAVAAAVEDGARLVAGVADPLAAPPPVADLVAAVERPWRRLGLPVSALARVVVTSSCGMAGARPSAVAPLLARLVEAARALEEVSVA